MKLRTRRKLSRMQRKEEWAGILFASPWLVGFLLFMAFPIFASLYMSFTSYDMITAPEWIGIANYEVLFTSDPIFWKSLWNTIYYVIFTVPLNLVIGILIAMLMNQKVLGMRFYRTIFYLPNVVSIVAVALLWSWILDPTFGLINLFLEKFGIEGPGWLYDPKWSKPAIILMGMWNVGGAMVIYLAALQDIPNYLYESASIDGAGVFRKFFRITLPLLTPSIFFNVVIGVILSFQVFTQAFIMTGGGPIQSSYFYAYYLYDKAFTDSAMGMASSMAWVLLVITLLLTLVILRSSNRWVYYQSGNEDKG
jgi:multiple sugar transport system permease protein